VTAALGRELRRQRSQERTAEWVERPGNRQRTRDNAKRRRQADPQAARQTSTRYARRARAVKRAAFVEHVEPLVVLELDDGVCGICGEDVDPFDFHIDHIHQLHQGGEHSYANVRVAHPSCNMRRKRKDAERLTAAAA
jgi:5-methylcytosine-specific restriction endonuclease McrA